MAFCGDILRSVAPESGTIFGIHDHRCALRTAAKKAGLKPEDVSHFSNHDFRHSRSTYWAERTNNLAGLAFVLGHKQITTTSRYVKGREKAGDEVIDAGVKRGL